MQERSFWSQLFDFSFSSFVTLKVIKVLYGLWIVIGVIAALSTLTGGLGMMDICILATVGRPVLSSSA